MPLARALLLLAPAAAAVAAALLGPSRSAHAQAAPPVRGAIATGISGVVEAFDARTMSFELRDPAGVVHRVDARPARFTARIGASELPAEFVDLRPGARVEVLGARRAGAPILATLVRITRAPSRAGTRDPYALPPSASLPGAGTPPPATAAPAAAAPAPGPAGATPAPSAAPGASSVPLRGILQGVDRERRLLTLRVDGREVPVHYRLTTAFEGIDAQSPTAGYLQPGDRLRVYGFEHRGEWEAERIVLEPPAAN